MPRFRQRFGRLLFLSVLCLMQACASQQADSGAYKSASIELNAAFEAGAALELEGDDDIGLVGRYHFATHTRDFDESLAFYKRLGYTNIKWLPESGSAEEAKAYGLEGPFTIKGADISLGRGDNHVLRLVQWITHFNPEQAYPPPINHIGINRIALVVPDVDKAVTILKRQGTKFLSEVAPCCSGTGDDETGIVHMLDPDGVFLELVGSIKKRPLQPQPEGCPALTIKMPPKVESKP